MGDQPKTQQQTLEDVRRAAMERRVAAHNRRVRGRIPLYTKAIGACRAAAVRGEDIRRIGIDTRWPKEFAPLTLEEKKLCRDEAAKQHATHAAGLEGAELRGATSAT